MLYHDGNTFSKSHVSLTYHDDGIEISWLEFFQFRAQTTILCRQIAVTAYFPSNQILMFTFAWQRSTAAAPVKAIDHSMYVSGFSCTLVSYVFVISVVLSLKEHINSKMQLSFILVDNNIYHVAVHMLCSIR